jgi:Ser/Thr protein kinase RdoA (MazF antagonist)
VSAEDAARKWLSKPVLAPLGAGHIHDTYLVSQPHTQTQFVLQRVNQSVFTDPQLVMAQTQRLLAHWRQQDTYVVPVLESSKSGAVMEQLGREYWRLWRYIGDTEIVDPIESPQQALAAGTAFAALQTGLEDLPGVALRETIPGFLQLAHYLQAYDKVAASAPHDLDRLVQSNRGLARQLSGRNAHIHGDCKVNNLLFDQSREKVVAIIDFDTAMYGHWAWDLGDLVRSVCFSRGAADANFFSACVQGFVIHQRLCNVDEAVAAPSYVALMLGVRFLNDHLTGDPYFRVEQHGENLHRAHEQFELFESFSRERTKLIEAANDVLARA